MMMRIVERTPTWALWLFVVVMTAAGVVGYNLQSAENTDQNVKIQTQADDLKEKGASIADLAAAVREANRRLAQAGEPPVPVPSASPTKPGVVFQSPTTADMDAAVTRYCASHTCRGPGVTKAQIKTAVLAYCATGACDGPAGTGGTGQEGPPPSDGQIAKAVAAYCAGGSCTGRGIAALGCTAKSPHGLRIQVTYTDGSTDTITCT